MKKSILIATLLGIAVVLEGKLVQAQQFKTAPSQDKSAPSSAPEFTSAVLETIQDIEDRTVAVAQDFPDDLYTTYRPKGNEDVRTAAEILLHIAEQNQSAASLIRTKQQEETLIAAGKRRPAKDILTFVSKADTVSKVKESFEAAREAIQGNPDPKNAQWWLYVIAHSNGHFGNLVTYYRNNGLVPPTSR